MRADEGKIQPGSGYRVWYRQVGAGGGTPLLVLHGGSGAGHDYLELLFQHSINGMFAGSQLVVFEEGSHIPHLEEEEKYLSVVSGFLSHIECRSEGTKRYHS